MSHYHNNHDDKGRSSGAINSLIDNNNNNTSRDVDNNNVQKQQQQQQQQQNEIDNEIPLHLLELEFMEQHKISIFVDCFMPFWNHEVYEQKSPISSPKNPPLPTTTLLSSFNRNTESYVIEALLEYCRIIFELFYENTTISLFSPLNDLHRLNHRDTSQQSLKFFVDRIVQLNFQRLIALSSSGNFILPIGESLENMISSHYEVTGDSATFNDTALLNELKDNLKSINGVPIIGKHQKKHGKNILLLILPYQDQVDLFEFSNNKKIYNLANLAKEIVESLNDKYRQYIIQQKKLQNNQIYSFLDENELGKKFELVIFKVFDQKTQQHLQSNGKTTLLHKYEKISDHLDCFSKEIPILHLFNAVSDLSFLQFDLNSVLVTGIPMKESSQNSTRAIYDVALLYSPKSIGGNKFNFHLFSKDKKSEKEKYEQLYPKISSLETRLNNEITLKWKTNDKKLNPETLACTCSHLITPFLVSSNPSSCLLKHICSGNSVFLVTPPRDDVFTHVLTLHGKEVYMHCLQNPLDIENIIPILDYYAKDLSKYRLQSFIDLAHSSTIAPSKDFYSKPLAPYQKITVPNPFYSTNTDAEEEIEKSISVYSQKNSVEKNTRYFPWLESETIFFNNEFEEVQKVLQPIKKMMIKDTLNNETLELLSKHIIHFGNLTRNNDPILFPQCKNNQNQRKECYRKVWNEFYLFSKLCQTCPNHIELFLAIEKMAIQYQFINQPSQNENNINNQNNHQNNNNNNNNNQNNNNNNSQNNNMANKLFKQQHQQQQQQQQYQQQQQQQQPLYQNLHQQQQQQQQQHHQNMKNVNEQTLWKQYSKGKKQAKEDDLNKEKLRQQNLTRPPNMNN